MTEIEPDAATPALLSRYRKATKESIDRLPARNLVFEFFFVFSRFEYGLLCIGYRIERNGSLFADWDRFAIERDGNFKPGLLPELEEAVQYYQKYPPMKQVSESGRLAFRDANPPDGHPLLQRLLVSARRVRNNLFHGEKLGALLEGYSERDIDLLRHGLTILYVCLAISNDLAGTFFSPSTPEPDEEDAGEDE